MRRIPIFVAVLLFSGHAFSQPDIEIKGSFQQTIATTPTRPTHLHAFAKHQPTSNTVTLLNVELSNHAKNTISRRLDQVKIKQNASSTANHPSTLPSKIQLGMNHVPVLDQGQHGSCAMFANTAAIDAILNRGDYISQLCLLQLGQHLEHFGYHSSGWNGSIGPHILQQIQAFGIISKTTQTNVGCGGLKDYPTYEQTPETDMSLSDYHALSEPVLTTQFAWSPLLDFYQVFLDQTDPEDTLEKVKTALSNHDRLSMGVLLFGPEYGVAGAIAQHHTANDTWVLPSDMSDMLFWSMFGGHAMIITGYDDEAIALDPEGHKHRGLLTLRNSWGEHIGDHGDFYMSYDYFKTLAIEVQRLRSLHPFSLED